MTHDDITPEKAVVAIVRCAECGTEIGVKLMKAGSQAQLTDDLVNFLEELADQVDANRPYLDEECDADDA